MCRKHYTVEQAGTDLTNTLRLALLVASIVYLWPVAAFGEPFAYIASSILDRVTVLDTEDDSVVTTIDVDMFPFDVAVSPSGSRVYVRSSNDTDPDTVAVIDAASNTVTTTIMLDDGVLGLAVAPSGSPIYAANHIANTLIQIDAESNTVIGSPLPVGPFPADIKVSPDGSRAYVANRSGTSISVVDTGPFQVIDTVIGLSSPAWIAVTPDGSHLLAIGSFGEVTLIETATNSIVDQASLGTAFLRGLAITSDGSTALLGRAPYDPDTFDVIEDELVFLDVATLTVSDTTPLPPGTIPQGASVFVTGIALTPSGDKAYVSMLNKGAVGVIEMATGALVDEIPGLAPSVNGQFIVPSPAFFGGVFSDGFESGDTSAW